MDFGEIFRVLRRRWRIAIPVLLVTIITTSAAYVVLPPKYTSTAMITLIGSHSEAAQPGNGNNPYLDVGNLMPMASILASSLSSDQTTAQLNADGVKDKLTAVVPPFSAGPFISLSLTDKSSRNIRAWMPIVIRLAMQRLGELQTSGSVRTPAKGLVRAVVIAPPSKPVAVKKTKIELVAGVAILGVVVSILLSFGAEGRAMRRNSVSKPGSGMRQKGSGRRPARPERENDVQTSGTRR